MTLIIHDIRKLFKSKILPILLAVNELHLLCNIEKSM